MTTLNAEKLTLKEVHTLLKLQMQLSGSFTSLLALEPLSELEQQELQQIRQDFANYLIADKVSEGLVKVLTTFPLLRLAHFYRFPIEIRLEEAISRIVVEEGDAVITGRLDILAVNQTAIANGQPFWVLLLEAKNSAISPLAGLPQLLTYAFRSLEYQASVWGLVTNGLNYQYVYLQRGNPPTYQLLPDLSLLDVERSPQILQVLKALCKLQGNPLSSSAVA